MQLTIHVPALSDAHAVQEVSALVKRRVEFAFQRFAPMIRRIQLRIVDINGPRGGLGVACRSVIEFTSGGTLVAKGLACSAGAAAQDAIERARIAVTRQLERARAYR